MKHFYDVEIPTSRKIESSQIVKVELDGFKGKDYAESELRNSLAETYGANFEIYKRFNPFPGIVFLAIAVVLSFFPYDLKSGTAQLNLIPNPICLFLSLIIYSSVVLRIKGLQEFFNSVTDVLISILCILLLATFIKVLLNDAVEKSGVVNNFLEKFGLGNSIWLMIIAIVLSWLGQKNIAKYVCFIVAVLGFVELCSIDGYMGDFKSIIFILSSFLGFVFYLKYEGKLITDSLKNTASNIITKTGISHIKTDGEKLGENIKLFIENNKFQPKTKDIESIEK